MFRVMKPPAPVERQAGEKLVFLAGSIEMGAAEDWQETLTQALSELPVGVLNPRRDSWDASWEQSISNPLFREQVDWELDGLEMADVIACYFAPNTKSPVTLLELGLLARSGKMMVCCPEGFWRRGNVEVVCRRYGVPMMKTLADLADAIRGRLTAT